MQINSRQLQSWIFFLVLFVSTPLWSEEYTFDTDNSTTRSQDPIRFELIGENTSIQPGHPFWVALHFDIEDRWHAYWKNPGDSGFPTEIDWNLPEGYEVNSLEWPYPQRLENNGSIGFGFENSATILAQITPAASDSLHSSAPIEAKIHWLVCSDESCLPGETTVKIQLPVSSATPTQNQEKIDFFLKSRRLLPQKNANANISIHEGRINLSLKMSSDNPLTIAYFCPNEEGIIDAKTAPLIIPNSESPNEYTFLLSPKNKIMPSGVKGVLVTEASGFVEAFDIDLPLSDELSIIGMNDREEGISQAELELGQIIQTEPRLPSPQDFDGGIGLALLFAFIGGIILNLMPCVLPVVSFKILGFVKMAGKSRTQIFKHGLAFSAGVLLSFWTLAGFMLVLQAYGQSVGWGFQLQEPVFVGALAGLLLLLALSLFGVFEMGTSLTSLAGNVRGKSQSSALTGSFFSGILATAVATPCTGPFLGSAVGFAVTLPTFWALLIFTSLGLGMASPYLLLAAFPSMLRFIPKPGAWMNIFKEVLGFVMLATVLWLVWVFSAQTSSLSIFLLLVSFFILSIGAWIYGHWGSAINKKSVRMVATLIATFCLGLAGYAVILSTSPELIAIEEVNNPNLHTDWEPFSPERVAELQAQGVPVFVDFTAKWCLICQANHIILSTNHVEQAFKDKGVVKMKADWTKNDPIITEALKQFGRNSVPLYILYGTRPSAQPTILPQVLTPDIVTEEVNKLAPSIAAK